MAKAVFFPQGFPESAEQLEALKQLGLNLDQAGHLPPGCSRESGRCLWCWHGSVTSP